MPQNTPMKRQFTTIDGRTVMSNLPQHWGGNDWKVTGVDNPLPVGNYIQTDSGVWIPQKGSDDGAADVRLTGSNVALDRKVFNRRLDLERGDYDLIIDPGEKRILRIKHLSFRVEAIADATSGDHRFVVYNTDPTTPYSRQIEIRDDFNKALTIEGSESKAKSIYPADPVVFYLTITNLVATKENPLVLRYRNVSNGTQTSNLLAVIVSEVTTIE